MKKRLKLILILVLVMITITCSFITVKANQKNENIKLTIIGKESNHLIAGNMVEFDINLELLSEEKANGIQFAIDYDPNILRLIEDNSFFPDRTTKWDTPTTSDDEGTIGFVSTREKDRADRSGKICNLVFEVLQTVDTTTLHMREGYSSFVEKLSRIDDYTLQIAKKGEQPDPTQPLYLSSDIYKIGNTDIKNYEVGDKYISRVEKETTLDVYMENLHTNGHIKVVKQDGITELTDNELVGTGMTLIVTKDEEKIELKIAVMGDLSGDGKVTAQDLSTLNQSILKTLPTPLENEYKIAGDLDENENITATDLSTILKMI